MIIHTTRPVVRAGKTKTMILSRSRTVHPQLIPLTLDGTVLKESADLVILRVTYMKIIIRTRPVAHDYLYYPPYGT